MRKGEFFHAVYITHSAEKQLKKAPQNIRLKFRIWLDSIKLKGLPETRKSSGWHDEPLKGNRKGQRSIRLNKQWRAIYIINKQGDIEFIEIQEVTPHEY